MLSGTIKSFFVPESNNPISTCFVLLHKYIIENTSECIDKPEANIENQNYYISNAQTGLLSPCHISCLTCFQSPTSSNQNCDSCKDGLLKDGNCVMNCGEGYYVNDNKCLKCHDNCKTCSDGIVTDSNGKITNMKCTQCKEDIINGYELKMIQNEDNCFPIIDYNNITVTFNISEIDSYNKIATCLNFNKTIFQGKFECIKKPSHTFYVLDNDENTGVIKNCSENCDSCEIEETNCINCTTGYYKTEDSNNKCYLEEDIPHNYYRNETDHIYYKCYPSCYNCSSGYDHISDNMSWISCINDYYFIYEEENKNCYDMSLIEQGFYLYIYNIKV